MEEHQQLPNADRLSVFASTILLAYAVTPFTSLPERQFTLNLPGVVFPFRFNLTTLVSFLVAILAAVGMDWLIRSHPRLGRQKTYQHWLLPAMTAWAIGVPLDSLTLGPQWWAVFGFGGALLILVFVAEYIVVDLSDLRHAPATVGLTAVSFALYLILMIAIRAAELRLYQLLPLLALPMFLVALRSLYLRLGGRWCVAWSLGIALVVAQIGTGLHYWPLPPLSFGLVMLGPAYALTNLAGSIEEGRPFRSIWIEPAIMLALIWGLAIVFRG